MHPWEQIRFAKGYLLGDKRIALAVTGSIAAVEAVKIARELIRHGAEVYPYMTKSALKFIGKDALLFATGHEPVVELTGRDEHLEDFDAILVAPATADIISKAACGIADDAVSTLILGNLRRCIFVPAMNAKMYENPILRENMDKLKKYAEILEPKEEEGELKVPSREKIAAFLIHTLRHELKGKKILVIGGAGYEKIDDFRIVSNLSSGRTAVLIGEIAYYLGAEVHLMLGLHSSHSDFLPYESFGTVEDLIGKIDEMGNYDAIIVPAALPDFLPEKSDGKINIEALKELRWKEAPKFLKELRKRYGGVIVGFKAESGVSEEELIARAKKRKEEYGLNMVVANDLRNVKYDENEVIIITDKEEKIKGSKKEIAMEIMKRVADELNR